MPRVLIVEDDPDIREFMELLLADAGYDTMTAENGSRALERMRARRPCLVLLGSRHAGDGRLGVP